MAPYHLNIAANLSNWVSQQGARKVSLLDSGCRHPKGTGKKVKKKKKQKKLKHRNKTISNSKKPRWAMEVRI